MKLIHDVWRCQRSASQGNFPLLHSMKLKRRFVIKEIEKVPGYIPVLHIRVDLQRSQRICSYLLCI